MRKNDRVDVHGIVHTVREGSKWHDGTGVIHGAVFRCGVSYRSSISRITRKLPPTCIFCVAQKGSA
jgi:hypothetical protein